jgi:hypothetical protein
MRVSELSLGRGSSAEARAAELPGAMKPEDSGNRMSAGSPTSRRLRYSFHWLSNTSNSDAKSPGLSLGPRNKMPRVFSPNKNSDSTFFCAGALR